MKEGGFLKFIHIADVHWGAVPDRDKSWGIQRGKEIKETFQRVIAYAQEQQTDLLLISGDFFHQPPSYQEIREVDYLLSKLSHTKTIWIAGNHDYLKHGCPFLEYEFQSDTILLSDEQIGKVKIPEMDTVVYGLSYWSDMIKEPLYDHIVPEEEDEVTILLAHGGDASHIPLNREKLKWSGFDYVALGHIHKPEMIFEDLMAYAGSLEPLDHTETGPHGLIQGEITEEKKRIEFIPFAKRQYVETEVFVSEDMGESEILDRIQTEMDYRGNENIHHIILEGTIDAGIHPDIKRLEDSYRISGIEYRMKSRWDYESLMEDGDLMLQNVATILKEKPKALSYAAEALMAVRENSHED